MTRKRNDRREGGIGGVLPWVREDVVDAEDFET